MKVKLWKPLEPGDRVDIIAPGMKPKVGTMKGIAPFIKSWDLIAHVPKNIQGHDLICSSTQEVRFQHLKDALYSPSKMVWCLRGGYGSIQLLDRLRKLKPPEHAKIFLGLSDITSLHLFLQQEWGWATIHGCNIDRFALGEGSDKEAKRIKDLVFAKKAEVDFHLTPLNDASKKSKSLYGSIVGGNLVTLQSSFATPFQLKTQGKILFMEEIGERAYRIDRIFQQMQQMGLWSGVRAVVFGQFTGGKEPTGKSLVPRLLQQFAESHKFPVFAGLPSGHGKNQFPLPLGVRARIQCGGDPILSCPGGSHK